MWEFFLSRTSRKRGTRRKMQSCGGFHFLFRSAFGFDVLPEWVAWHLLRKRNALQGAH